MTDFNITVPEIEGRLRTAGISVDRFCEMVGVNRATWQRWKAGTTSPRVEVWRRVIEAVPEAPPGASQGRETAA